MVEALGTGQVWTKGLCMVAYTDPNPTVSVEGGIFTLQLQALHQIFTQGCSYACVMHTITTGDEHVVTL